MQRAAVLVIWLLGACSANEPRLLFVDLRTDFVPSLDFVTIETVVSRVDGRGVRTSPATFALTVSADQPFDEGVRIGEFATLEGPLSLEVYLLARGGRTVAERTTLLDSNRPDAVTIVMTRSCQDIVCPNAADGTPMACVGGGCVDATCSPETPESCGTTECETEADCQSGLALECASARCIDGYCFVTADSSLCPRRDRCDFERGCVPEDALECRDDDDCTRDNAVGRCDAGSRCSISSCQTGFADCDGLVDNGCEAELADPMHCGTCDNRCGPWPNALVACGAGVCSIESCLPGFQNCDANILSGCETNLSVTCGVCGGCGSQTCCSGICVRLDTNENCGGCGRVCRGGLFCAGGDCVAL